MAAIVEQPESLYLRRREVLCNVHWYDFQLQLSSGLQPGVAGDDCSSLVHDNGLAKPEFADRGRDFINRLSAELPCVARIRNWPFWRPHFDVHLPPKSGICFVLKVSFG